MTHIQYNTDGTLMPQTLTRKAMEMKKTSADVVRPNFSAKSPCARRKQQICWSGSKDGQTSADTFQGGVHVGAMSYVRSPLTKDLAHRYLMPGYGRLS